MISKTDMEILAMMEAKVGKLEDIYKNFDPPMPLDGTSEFYVNRIHNPLDSIRKSLMRRNRIPLSILFSGHRGSGKSTELNKLMTYSDIQSKYFIVYYSVKETLDIVGLDYIDLLISIGAQIFMVLPC